MMSDVPIQPTGFRVLIRSDQVSETVDAQLYPTLGKDFQLTDKETARKQKGQVWGTVIAKGPMAFKDSKIWGENESDLIPIGTKVYYERYSGQPFTTPGVVEAGTEYILVSDESVFGIVNDTDLIELEDQQ